MLHDLLSAVRGNSGDMFVWKKDYSVQIINDLGLLHPCEVSVIEDIMIIAGYYKRITHFSDKYDIVQLNNGKDRSGIYMSSLAWSLRNATESFHNTIVGVEEKLLSVPSLTLTSALSKLQSHAPTLGTLDTMVTEIESEKIWGCKILEVLHKYASNSVAQVKDMLVRMEQEVHSVLYDQLTHWLLHGLLMDPHQEFFITANTDTHKRLEALSLDEDRDVGICSNGDVCLRLELLPSHIPLQTAQKILFVGEAIQVFKQRGTAGDWDINDGGIWNDCGAEMDSVLKSLGEEQSFSLPRLNNAIHTITNAVSQTLWELVVGGGLVSALGDLKGVYLLGRGELYQALLPTLTQYLSMPTPPSLDNLDALFQAAGRQVLIEDSLLDKFTLTLSPPDKNKKENLWNRLSVEYKAEWPLHRIFNSSTQQKYSTIFRFLLSVRRTQHRLQQLWMIQMRTSKYREGGGCLQWTLRHHMSLLIDNIQYYLQVDVLESEHWRLIESIVSGSKDYQQLTHAHSVFLSSMTSRCFMNHPVLSGTINQLLNLVHKFCDIVETGSTTTQTKEDKPKGLKGAGEQASQTNPKISSEIEEIAGSLERVSGQLFFVLCNVGVHHGSQHTAQLIMRMDYNRYYSTNDTVRRFGVSVAGPE